MPRQDRNRKTRTKKITAPSKLGSVSKDNYYNIENVRGREAQTMMTTFGRPIPKAKPTTRTYYKPKARAPRKK